jgi:hypothetical protein
MLTSLVKLTTLFAAVASSAAGDVPSVVEFPALVDHSYYPAHVRAVHFANGKVLDGTHSFGWHAWTVSFGPQPPIATWNATVFPEVDIPVTCGNAIAGTSSCSLEVTKGLGSAGYCFLEINSQPIEIACPEAIELAP